MFETIDHLGYETNFTNQITEFSTQDSVDRFPIYCLCCAFRLKFTFSDRLKNNQTELLTMSVYLNR